MSVTWPPNLAVVQAIVIEASRAPSVHNVQPARWAVSRRSGLVFLFRDPARTLPVADPRGHDDRVSLGAALEGFAIAASTRGLAIASLAWGAEARALLTGADVAPLEPVAAITLRDGATADPLAVFVEERRAWRGPMEHGSGAAAALERLAADPEAGDVVIAGPEHADMIARLVDTATWAFERQPAYHAELWKWLRLDRKDPSYRRDGLTADALVLSEAERIAARVALHPRVFRLLQRTGLGRAVVSEAAATRTAAGFVCHCPPVSATEYDVGRAMHRAWLAATRAGLVMAPMSALVDDIATRAALEALVPVPVGRRLVQVFRAGTTPGPVPRSPRLPVSELLQVFDDGSFVGDGER